MTTLADLTTPLSVADAEAAIYAALQGRGINVTLWKSGAPTRTMVFAFAIIVAALTQVQAILARSGFLGLSKGPWLRLVALYVYGVVADEGSFATGKVQLDNTGGGVYAGDPGDLVATNPDTGKSYRNTEAFSIDAFETDVLVAIQAIEIGSDSTSGPNTITVLETALLGVNVTNPNAVVGADAEDDTTLQLRCAEKTGTLSPNGPRDAYAFVARSTKRADGSSIGVTRVKTIADGIGGVDVYVATASGLVTGTVGDLDTDLGLIDDAIQKQCAPLAITARTHSATPLDIDVTYTLWVSDTVSLTDDQIKAAVADVSLTNLMASRPIGGDLLVGESTGRVYVSLIEATVGTAVPKVLRVTIALPAADVDVAPTEAPVLNDVTATIHQVAGDVI